MQKRTKEENPGAMYCRECWGSTKWIRWWVPEHPGIIFCPKCHGKKLKCLNARRVREGRRRQYECQSCGARFLSTERFTDGVWMGGRQRRYKCKSCGKYHISEEIVENNDLRIR